MMDPLCLFYVLEMLRFPRIRTSADQRPRAKSYQILERATLYQARSSLHGPKLKGMNCMNDSH